ncbi:MAG: chemotaxis protein CheA [Candidatus Hodarchaeota archaeon]
METDDDKMTAVLFSEVREILSGINTHLIALEREQTDLKALKEIMRYAHTLKGLFAATEFEELTRLCHIAEDAIVELTKIGFVDSEALTILFSFLNKLEEVFNLASKKLDEVSKSQKGFDLSLLMKTVSDGLEVDLSILIGELQTLTTGPLKIGTKYRLIVSFDPECRLKGARAFQVLSALEAISKILFSNPTKNKIEDGAVFSDLNVIVITQEDEASIQETVSKIEEVSNVQIERIFDVSEDTDKDREIVRSVQSVRVPLVQLDQMMDLLGELVIERNALVQQLQLSGLQSRLFSSMDRTIDELRDLILKTRLVPLEYIFEHFPRLVREAVKNTGKNVKSIISGKKIEVDRTSIDLLNETLIHLIRNAIDHGIEPDDVRRQFGKDEQGLIEISAKLDRTDVLITVSDNGQGIDVQSIRERAIKEGYIKEDAKLDREGLIALLFLSGFSTSEKVTKLSGRGIGLNIAYSNIEKLNGTINVETQKGVGTRFTIRIPSSLSILQALVVRAEENLFTIPLGNISRVYRVTDEKVFYHNNRPFIVVNQEVIPVASVKESFSLLQSVGNKIMPVNPKIEKKENMDKVIVLWEQAGKRIGVLIDSIIGQQQIVFKKTDKLMSQVKGFSGFTLIGEGTIVPILDPNKLIGAI